MPEIRKTEAQTMDERCPICQKGWMRPTGIVLTSEPPMFEHSCVSCGNKQNYYVKYPYIVQ